MAPDRLDVLGLLLLAASIRLGAAIRCYECIPTEEDNCLKLPSSLTNCTFETVTNAIALLTRGVKASVEAPPNDSQLKCLKLKASESDTSQATVIRTCMLSIPSICGVLTESASLSKYKPAELDCFMCDVDGCNTASTVVPASLACLLAISATL